MKRREAVIALLALGTPFCVGAQAVRMRRIGILVPTVGETDRYEAFIGGMRKFGWIEGQNLVIDRRYAEAKYDRVTALVQELIKAGAEVIVTNSTPAVINARKASTTIPIVAAAYADPVASGLAASLASPGGNVTGVSIIFDGILDKMFELAFSMVPKLSRVAFLINAGNPSSVSAAKRLGPIVLKAGATPLNFAASTPQEMDAALSSIVRERSEALLVNADPFLFGERQRIAAFGLKQRLPTFAQSVEFVESGFLASYGPDFRASFSNAASFVDRILKGAKPGELPIEQVTKLEQGINLKTARALGLQIPQSVMLRADRVIE